MQTPNHAERIARLQAAMKEFGLRAVILEPGPVMLYLTGVRWGRSERVFAVLLPAKGGPVWVLPAFEEMRAREMIHAGELIRLWQEDESPYRLLADAFKARGITTGKVGIDDTARFFVFDGIRKLAPKLHYVGVQSVIKAAGVGMP